MSGGHSERLDHRLSAIGYPIRLRRVRMKVRPIVGAPWTLRVTPNAKLTDDGERVRDARIQ